jgi:hypothetical protein
MANTISIGTRTITIVPDGSTNFDIATLQSNIFPLNTIVGNFTAGESVIQATSSATGVVVRWDAVNGVLWLTQMTGTFDATHVITGASSAAHGIPNEVKYAFPDGIRLSAVDFYPSVSNDTLIIRERAATGSIIYERKDVGGGGIHKATGGRSLKVKPFILYTEQVFSTPSGAKIILEFD